MSTARPGRDAHALLQEALALVPDPAALADALVLQAMPGYMVRKQDSRAAALFETCTGQSSLTPRQFGLLKVVHDRPGIRQSDLAKALDLDRSTLGEMVQRMADRDLITRRPHETDRRTSTLGLTDSGEEALLATVSGAIEAQRRFLEPLPAYLRPVFLACLQMLDTDPTTDGPAALERGDEDPR